MQNQRTVIPPGETGQSQHREELFPSKVLYLAQVPADFLPFSYDGLKEQIHAFLYSH